MQWFNKFWESDFVITIQWGAIYMNSTPIFPLVDVRVRIVPKGEK